jgi:hypothetical protein
MSNDYHAAYKIGEGIVYGINLAEKLRLDTFEIRPIYLLI